MTGAPASTRTGRRPSGKPGVISRSQWTSSVSGQLAFSRIVPLRLSTRIARSAGNSAGATSTSEAGVSPGAVQSATRRSSRRVWAQRHVLSTSPPVIAASWSAPSACEVIGNLQAS